MGNLGGHDLPSLLEAFEGIDHDRPVVFIAYTVKGMGLPLAGHKDNHAGLLTPAQMEGFRASANVRPGHEWDRFEGLGAAEDDLERFLEDVPFNLAALRHVEYEGTDDGLLSLRDNLTRAVRVFLTAARGPT